jgi:hypothetical protein
MAWIKVRINIHNQPEVLGIARACSLGVDTVVGKLFRMWAWFDEMSVSGHVSYGTNVWLDSFVGHEGFSEACVKVGWLESSSDGLTMPNFDRHNGESSKKRLTDAARKRKSRSSQIEKSASSPQNVREMSQEKCDQRREEKRREETTTTTVVELPKELEPYKTAVEDWLAYKREKGQTYKPRGLKTLYGSMIEMGVGLPAAVKHSMANNYTGLFSPSGNGKQPDRSTAVSQQHQRGLDSDEYGL